VSVQWELEMRTVHPYDVLCTCYVSNLRAPNAGKRNKLFISIVLERGVLVFSSFNRFIFWMIFFSSDTTEGKY
jgi:hypothetical protein